MTVDVCNDYALQRWVLGWGSGATVVAPAALRADIAAEFERSAEKYQASLRLMEPPMSYVDNGRPARGRARSRRRVS